MRASKFVWYKINVSWKEREGERKKNVVGWQQRQTSRKVDVVEIVETSGPWFRQRKRHTCISRRCRSLLFHGYFRKYSASILSGSSRTLDVWNCCYIMATPCLSFVRIRAKSYFCYNWLRSSSIEIVNFVCFFISRFFTRFSSFWETFKITRMCIRLQVYLS